MDRETAWLIEIEQSARNGPPVFWGVEEGYPGWTADHNYAKRFDSKEAAEQEASDLGLNDFIVAEHAWQ